MFVSKKKITQFEERIKLLEEYAQRDYKRLNEHDTKLEKHHDELFPSEEGNFFTKYWQALEQSYGISESEPEDERSTIAKLTDNFEALCNLLKIDVSKTEAKAAKTVAKFKPEPKAKTNKK